MVGNNAPYFLTREQQCLRMAEAAPSLLVRNLHRKFAAQYSHAAEALAIIGAVDKPRSIAAPLLEAA